MDARRTARSLAVVLTAAAMLLSTTPPAGASHGGPSASEVAASKARVATLEAQVRAASAVIARNQAALEQLATQAEVAIENYNKAQVVAAAAERRVESDRAVLDLAAARVSGARSTVGEYGAAAYRGGDLSSVEAVLGSSGPQSLFDRLSALDAVARAQRNALQELGAAQVFQHGVEQRAAALAAQAAGAAKAADAARRQAQAKVDAQAGAVRALTAAQHHLSVLLHGARAHASALVRARLAALARERAEAAARAAAAAKAAAAAARQRVQDSSGGGSSGGGGGGSYANTVSAATERQALSYAESQLGKPYEWGASGPDTYDCSGLVMWAYAKVGVNVDHWTGYQWNEGAHIPVSALRAGDLLFFATDTSNPDTIHHVGIYVGNGQMLEAPYTGANVRYSNAFRSDLIGAVRLYQR